MYKNIDIQQPAIQCLYITVQNLYI